MYRPTVTLLLLLTLASLVGGGLANSQRKGDSSNTDVPNSLDVNHGVYNSSASEQPHNRYGGVYLHPKPADVPVGCKELRSKRYISDGFCTSIKPITEVVCTGHCLPIKDLPWYAEFIKVWARTKILEWRCVEDKVRRKKVKLLCENNEKRTYKIKVVKSCKCKRYMRQQNKSHKRSSKRHRRRKDSAHNYSPASDTNRSRP